MNFSIVFHIIGWVLNFEAACMSFSLICALICGEPTAITFAICMLICLAAGIPLTVKKPKDDRMYAKEGYAAVALCWIAMSVFGSLPFIISGAMPNFFDAFFETASGFSTTGASVLSDVEVLPKSILFWRSFTHWMGGMGVLVLVVALLPLCGGSNMYLIKAESPGPSVSKLVPKVKSTALILYSIYVSLTFAEVILLLIGKMSLFEALTLSFGTAGTGGFGIVNSSIADYSPYVQWVITVFMLIFGVDFSVYYLLLVKRAKGALRSDELRTYIGIVITATVLICVNCRNVFDNIPDLVRASAFQVASIITTTGYSTANFDLWPEFSKAIIVFLMLSGACAGSTGGGIKVSRIVILVKSIIKEIKLAAHPRSTLKITMNGKTVEHEVLRSVNVFIMAYLVTLITSVLILSIDGHGFTTNVTAVIAALNNIGPGLSEVGPARNFGFFSNLSKFVLSFDMLAGRLEIIPMLVLFSPYSWKK